MDTFLLRTLGRGNIVSSRSFFFAKLFRGLVSELTEINRRSVPETIEVKFCLGN